MSLGRVLGLLLVVALGRHGDDANESGGKRNRSATGSQQGDDNQGKRRGAVKRRSQTAQSGRPAIAATAVKGDIPG